MKKYISYLSFLLLLGLGVLSSCDENVTNPTDTDVRSKYAFTWTCQEIGGMSYPVTITKDPNNSTQVLMANFHYLGNDQHAIGIPTATTLTIGSQELCGNTIHGNGTLVNDNKITLKYYVDNHSSVDTVEATYSK
jgi:hypothetical protein